MRSFSSYGPINTKLHYYAPREDLINRVHIKLIGVNLEEGGHYITVWGPRQTGKTWAMQQILFRLQNDDRFDVLMIPLEHLKMEDDIGNILNSIGKRIADGLNVKISRTGTPEEFERIFRNGVLTKPLVLILDEFDALTEDAVSILAGIFRNIYNIRQYQLNETSSEKDYLLHGLALLGVRSVLGIENAKGSPFNVQRSMHIPNFEFSEVAGMFKWYEKESGQQIKQEVIERVFYETAGQPGLTCWFAELLTGGFDEIRVDKNKPVDMNYFEESYAAAVSILPNNNILNIISKAKKKPYMKTVLELFRTDKKIEFRYDDSYINYLYMNGVIDMDKSVSMDKQGLKSRYYVKFSCPFVQKRLFNYFSGKIFNQMGRLYEPFDDLDDAVTEQGLNIENIIRRYHEYLMKNREWSLKNAPRRSDMRIYEAVFHFNLYMYLVEFLQDKGGEVFPEFPTGNGQIDIIIKYGCRIYGLELKSYKDKNSYKKALIQAARYGEQLKVKEIFLIFFIENIDDKNRKKYEVDWFDEKTGIKVIVIFVETDNSGADT